MIIAPERLAEMERAARRYPGQSVVSVPTEQMLQLLAYVRELEAILDIAIAVRKADPYYPGDTVGDFHSELAKLFMLLDARLKPSGEGR